MNSRIEVLSELIHLIEKAHSLSVIADSTATASLRASMACAQNDIRKSIDFDTIRPHGENRQTRA